MDADERQRLLARVDWFAGFTDDELRWLGERGEDREFAAGEVVYREGDPGDHCFVVHHGVVRVLRSFRATQSITLAELHDGELFGQFALFGSETRPATVQALDRTTAVALGALDVRELLLQNADAAFAMLMSTAHRLREAHDRITVLGGQTVRGRVAATLLARLEARREQPGAPASEVVGSPSDIARLAGASRREVTKFLGVLESRGALSARRGRIVITDEAALRDYLG